MHYRKNLSWILCLLMSCVILTHAHRAEAQGYVTKNSPVYEQLALIDTGQNPPPNYLIKQFQATLNSIHSKCSADSKELLSDYIVWGRNELKKSGNPISLIRLAKATDQSLPPDAATLKMKCSEVVAVLVTLIQAQ